MTFRMMNIIEKTREIGCRQLIHLIPDLSQTQDMPRATRSATATAKANQANGVVPQVSPPAKTKPQAIKTQGKALKAAPASKFLDLKETAQDHLKPLDTKHKLAKVAITHCTS
ncbi:uncharacterized protein LOC131889081 [Tigriopus californicus]|uniref:uncharacterized protein LOC131889081 n=1 Tax=Tigriopus californicus TaxID=6832 RepID=UPI0027DA2BBC|nr:uncharacterized protein LOC131889081 [Tigriopus californicus]